MIERKRKTPPAVWCVICGTTDTTQLRFLSDVRMWICNAHAPLSAAPQKNSEETNDDDINPR